MKIRAKYWDGTTLEALVGPRAEVEVERRFNISLADAFIVKDGGPAPRLDYFYVMCWAALKYSGHDVPDYDAWLELLEDAEEITEPGAAKANPTRRGRRPAKSST